MKKVIAFVLVLVCILGLVGCSKQPVEPINTIKGDLRTYHEMSDGTWQFEGHTYKYRLVISGRMPNAAVDSTFVYLSNLENITFQQAYMAAGLSSNMADYFDVTEAVLVEWL
ncbi:MAG: immunogenic protein [Ruminococcaceae bacterium]|nr:immunogenic protein [Oscillospiraceae bacterium]